MKELFVTYEVAKQLKEIGFEEKCIARYVEKQFQMNVLAEWYNFNGGDIKGSWISAPLYDQVINWLLNKNIYLEVNISYIQDEQFYFRYEIQYLDNGYTCLDSYLDRNDVLNKGILKCIELINDDSN